MFNKNILTGNAKDLQELKELVLSREQHEKELKELQNHKESTKKQLEKRRKEIEKEISEMEQSERKAIAVPYDKKISNLEKEKKDILDKKAKERKEKIERMAAEETSSLKNEGEMHKEEIRKLSTDAGMPGFCISRLFLAFFYPRGIKDVMTLCFGLMIIFFIIPFGSYQLFWKESTRLSLTTIYLIVSICFFIIYILLNNCVKEKYLSTFREINKIRNENHKTERAIKEIVQKIEKTQDAELDLGEYDEKLKEKEAEIADIKKEKESKLSDFDNNAEEKEDRARKIWSNNKSLLDELQFKIDEITNKQEQKQSELIGLENSLNSDKYKPLRDIEKNIFKIKVLDELIECINDGETPNIKLAIEKRQNPKASTSQK